MLLDDLPHSFDVGVFLLPRNEVIPLQRVPNPVVEKAID